MHLLCDAIKIFEELSKEGLEQRVNKFYEKKKVKAGNSIQRPQMEERNYNTTMRDRAVVARVAHNHEVAGSIPAPATKFLGRLLGHNVWPRVKACGGPRLTAQDGFWPETLNGLVGFPV